ncbi:MAG: hypothetical protein K0S74_225 [Chlamydiales bacterium]|jgi:glycerol-3-phosphate dehydrogenase (NAD(P)+)|nr:hypothetical protein [Chlamydiales bacterium]
MIKKIACLGAGAWGFCLAVLLAKKGFNVTVWLNDAERAAWLQQGKEHPYLAGAKAIEGMKFTTNLAEVLDRAELIVESVTSAGVRPVFEAVKEQGIPDCPIVVTSKGIEQNTGMLLSEVLIDVLGEDHLHLVGCLSGPSLAEYVFQGQPTSVVSASYASNLARLISTTFTTSTFRVYPNTDINGVLFGGAMKNVIAIACGMSDGLGFGDNSKAALMTRGLHEMRKLSVTKQCNPETLNGLAGLGDLCVTCLANSRNYRFGRLLAQGLSVEEAKLKIGMVVEGVYSCLSAIQLAEKNGIPIPISQMTYQILYEGMKPIDAVKALMTRTIKEEHL